MSIILSESKKTCERLSCVGLFFFFTSENKTDATWDVRRQTVRYRENTTSVRKHLRYHHTTQHEKVVSRSIKINMPVKKNNRGS